MYKLLMILILLLAGCGEPKDYDYSLYEIDVVCRYPGKENIRERMIADFIVQDDGATTITFLDDRTRRYTGDCVFDSKKIIVKTSKKYDYVEKFNAKN